MKLSKTQKEVIKLMANKWGLCIGYAWGHQCWLEGVCGRDIKYISIATAYALINKRIILVNERRYLKTTYKLTVHGEIMFENLN